MMKKRKMYDPTRREKNEGMEAVSGRSTAQWQVYSPVAGLQPSVCHGNALLTVCQNHGVVVTGTRIRTKSG